MVVTFGAAEEQASVKLKILIAVGRVAFIAAFSLVLGTQFYAFCISVFYSYGVQRLGLPWFNFGELVFYPPWAIVRWWWLWHDTSTLVNIAAALSCGAFTAISLGAFVKRDLFKKRVRPVMNQSGHC